MIYSLKAMPMHPVYATIVKSERIHLIGTRFLKYTLELVKHTMSDGRESYDIDERQNGRTIAKSINLQNWVDAQARFEQYVDTAKADGILYVRNLKSEGR